MNPSDSPSRDDRIDEAIAAYLQAAEEGQKPDREVFLSQHADIAAELRDFLGDISQFRKIAGVTDSESDATFIDRTPNVRSEPSASAFDEPTITFQSGDRGSAQNVIRYFGDYELIHEIARGGMGVVYKARQVKLNRIVAVKMILAGQFAGLEDVQRFNTEAEATAQLDHPGIVPIYEVGQHDGQYYFSMGFVDGQSLAKRVADGPLEPCAAVEIVRSVSEAVQYAHDKGVIHRDLKPGNILMDRAGNPRVTDFGLAKLTDSGSDLTGTGQILGTPSYMPPEQATAQVNAVGRLSDVYSLGAIMYCLLTGRPPFQAANPLETLLQVQNQDPVPPRQLNPTISLDLDTIVLKCLDKSPGRRYSSAQALADELTRVLEGRPILARRVGCTERFVRWCRREPIVAGLIGAVIATLIMGTAISAFFAFKESVRATSEASARNGEKNQRERAEQQTELARTQAGIANAALNEERLAKEHERTAKQEALDAAKKEELARINAERQLRIAKAEQWAALSHMKQSESIETSLILAVESCRVTSGDHGDVRPSSHHSLMESLSQIGGRPLIGHDGDISKIEISPNCRWIVTGSKDKTARVWDLNAKNPNDHPRVLMGHRAPIESIAISPDSHWVVTGSEDNTARIWDLTAKDPTKSSRPLLGHQKPITSIAISSDGHWIATASIDATARVWDLTSEDPAANPRVLKGHSNAIDHVVFSPDCRWVITNSTDKTARVWDLNANDSNANPRVLNGHQYKPGTLPTSMSVMISDIVISPDSRWFVTWSIFDVTARVWDMTAENPAASVIVLDGHQSPIKSVGISRDNRWIVTGSFDKTARIWDLASQNPAANSRVLSGHSSSVNSVAISGDSHLVVTGSADETARLWDLTSDDPDANSRILSGHRGSIENIAITSDNHSVVTVSRDKTARIWDLKSQNASANPRVLYGHQDQIRGIAMSRDGRWIVTECGSKNARVWDLALEYAGANPLVFKGNYGNNHLAVSSDSHWLVAGSLNGTIVVWDLTVPNPSRSLRVLIGQGWGLTCIAISPDSHWIVTGSNDKSVRIWDLTAENPSASVRVLNGHQLPVSSLAISHDSRWVVTGSNDKTVRVWDLSNASPETSSRVLTGHAGEIDALVLSADGRWIVSGSNDNTARVWDFADPHSTGRPLVFNGYLARSKGVVISSDNRWIVTRNSTQTARIWDLQSKNPAIPFRELSGRSSIVSNVVISPDCRWIAGGSEGNTAIVLDLLAGDSTHHPRFLSGHAGSVSSVAASSDSRWVVTGSGDNTARIWDLSVKNPSASPIVLSGYLAPITYVTFSPDGRWIVMKSNDGTIQLWRWQPEDLVALAGNFGRNLDQDEWERYFPDEPYRLTFPNLPAGGEDRPAEIPDFELPESISEEHLRFKIPKSFSFQLDAKISDADPGVRVWTRVGNTTFVERLPSGGENKSRILERAEVRGIKGTIVERIGFEKLQVFIPDRESKNLEIKYHFVDRPDHWVLLGTLENVE